MAILPQIYPFLLQACLVETNLNCLQHYLLFLTQNYPHDKLYESVIGISQLIVDRFVIIKKIISPTTSSWQYEVLSLQGSNTIILQGSLLELFRNAMEAALRSQTMPQLSSSANCLLVTFPSTSQKAILHTSFIQAIFLLLSHDHPHGTSHNDFTYLLDLWMPTQPLNRPEACTVESKKEISLPPSEVLCYTLLSTNVRVLEASIAAAQPFELCKFVQEFGCPAVSADKVLEVLDELCKEHSVATELRHCVSAPEAMARCIEIQMRRKIKSGKHFLTFIRGLANISPSDDVSDNDYRIGVAKSFLRHQKSDMVQRVMSQSSLESSPTLLKKMSVEDAEEQLLHIFQSSPHSNEAKMLMYDLKKVLNLKRSSASGTSKVGVHLTSLITALNGLSTGTSIKRMQFLEGMVKNQFSLTLLRMITKFHEIGLLGRHLSELFKNTLRNISESLESSRHKMVKLKYYPSFMAVLKTCCKKLNVVDSNLAAEGVTEIMWKACRDVKVCINPFENESALIKLCRDIIQNNSSKCFESLISFLVKRAVVLKMESRCIKLLEKIKVAVTNGCVPIAFQCNSELFMNKPMSNVPTSTPSSKDLEMIGGTDVNSFSVFLSSHFPDVTGLLVDVFELLDPEIISLSPDASMRFIFGLSEVPLSRTRDSNSSSAANFLLSGEGYLLARVVNTSSWCSLLGAVNRVLDKTNVPEW